MYWEVIFCADETGKHFAVILDFLFQSKGEISFHKAAITVPADVLAPNCARPSVSTGRLQS